MISLNVTRSEQKKFDRELKRFIKKSRKKFEDRLDDATAYMHREAVDNAPRSNGDLRQKIKMNVDDRRLTGEVDSNAEYSAAVENGRKPHMPPVNASLKDWAHKHNIDPWALAMSIKKKGTKAQPFMYPAWDKAQSKFLKDLRRAFK